MNILIIIWILLLICYLAHNDREFDRQSIRGLVRFGCFLLFLESGLRHISVGPDTPGYYSGFYKIVSDSWSNILGQLFVNKTEFRDPGYAILVKTFSAIFPSWQMFLIFSAALYYYAFGCLMARFCNSRTSAFLGLTLILALFNIIALSGVRQMFTMSISMFTIESIFDKQWRKFIPLIAIGSLIHVSCLFVLLFIPFAYIDSKIQHKIHFIAIIAFPLIAVFARNIVFFLADFLANDYYKGYALKANEGITSFTYVAIVFFMTIFIYTSHNSLNANSTKQALFLQPAAILMTLAAPLILQDGSMIRISQYFTIYLTITIGNIVDLSINKKIEYIIMFAFLLYYIINQSDYHFFWQEVSGYTYKHPLWGV